MSEQREGAKLVEILHLALLQVMPSYLPVSDYAVKGGANLRLFYGSRRRSQDIDFDYLGGRFHAVDGPDAHLSTKVEFSGREADAEHAFETARGDLGRAMGLRVVKAEHYLPPAAIRQKIRALANRRETEPRDVFDLDLLFAIHRDKIALADVDLATLARAADAALNIPYEAYVDLVVQYVEDEFVAIYGRPEVWTDMTLRVVEQLERLR